MTDRLDGKVAIVTGGGAGIGRGIAMAFAREGAQIAVVDVRDAAAQSCSQSIADLGGVAVPIVADVGSREACQAIVSDTLDRLGPPDILVNNAISGFPLLPFEDVRDEDLERVLDVSTRATFWLMQQTFPHMREQGGGSILNLGSNAATMGFPRHAPYAAAKEAIRGLSRVAAREWGRHSIRVNVIIPIANSEGMTSWAKDANQDFDAFLRTIPMGRLGDCELDIGQAAVFLASDEARYITGQTLWVDGGAGGVR